MTRRLRQDAVPTSDVAPGPAPLERLPEEDDVVGPWTPWRHRFTLLSKLSDKGSEGHVWEAEESGGARVALKIHWGTDGPMRPPFTEPLHARLDNVEALAGLMGDVAGLVRCRSPFLGPPPLPVNTTDAISPRAELQTCVYLPMKLVEGRSLEDLALAIPADAPLEVRWPLMTHVFDALNTICDMQERGLTHGDFRARNVMCTRDERDNRATVVVDPSLSALHSTQPADAERGASSDEPCGGVLYVDKPLTEPPADDLRGLLEMTALILLGERPPCLKSYGDAVRQGLRIVHLLEPRNAKVQQALASQSSSPTDFLSSAWALTWHSPTVQASTGLIGQVAFVGARHVKRSRQATTRVVLTAVHETYPSNVLPLLCDEDREELKEVELQVAFAVTRLLSRSGFHIPGWPWPTALPGEAAVYRPYRGRAELPTEHLPDLPLPDAAVLQQLVAESVAFPNHDYPRDAAPVAWALVSELRDLIESAAESDLVTLRRRIKESATLQPSRARPDTSVQEWSAIDVLVYETSPLAQHHRRLASPRAKGLQLVREVAYFARLDDPEAPDLTDEQEGCDECARTAAAASPYESDLRAALVTHARLLADCARMTRCKDVEAAAGSWFQQALEQTLGDRLSRLLAGE